MRGKKCFNSECRNVQPAKRNVALRLKIMTSIFKNPKHKNETEIHLKIQSVPRSKHTTFLLYKPVINIV